MTAAPLAEFVAEWTAVFGEGDSQFEAGYWLRRGVAVEMLRPVAGLVSWAVPRWGPGQAGNAGTFATRVQQVMLLRAGGLRMCKVATPEQEMGWLEVIAGAATFPAALQVVQAVTLDVVRAWADVPGALGPWGWAAGLLPSGAADLTLGEVQAVAALRGFVVAPELGSLGAKWWR